MSRQSAVSVENSFIGGLKTDFSGLNFPENACTETFDCIFNLTGLVTRRYGIDYELNYTLATIDRTLMAISTYLWRNVAGDGNTNLLVVQVGGTLYFYDASAANATTPLSSQKLASTVTLSTYAASGAPAATTNECQFADGNGYLFVFHPSLEPFYVSYSSGTLTGTAITVKIRDFTGIVEAGVSDVTRPVSLTANHNYNLGNQGWTSVINATSTDSYLIGTGSKTFTTQASLGIIAGDRLRVYSAATPGSMGASTNTGNIMMGTTTSYSGTTLVVNVTATNGAGTLTDWHIVQEPDNITAWNVLFSNYPSNADVWWQYKNSSDVFAPTTKILDTLLGNTPAPKGHYILDAFSEDRSTVSGVATLSTVTTSGARPTTGSFHQGRVFYGGVQYTGYNSKIYFSQIIERSSQFGLCYQQGDPTSEDNFDLLPADGGVIQIQGAGTITKMISLQGALLVFCLNGIWAVTGSSAIGFTANDYTVQKISDICVISASSFVTVLGFPMFWNDEGIYAVSPGQGGGMQVVSLTDGQISSFYQSIPPNSRRYARGYYNPVEFVVQWIYRTTDAHTLTDNYEFDGVLNYNTLTKAFYPWVIGDGNPTVNGITVVQGTGGIVTTDQVVSNSGADTVQDGSGNNVVVYSLSGQTVISPTFKYLTSLAGAGTYTFTFSGHYDTTYLDWDSNATGIGYTSYFITGYKVHGDAQRKFQPNYVYLFSLNDEPTSYAIQGIWNFANTGGSGQYSSQQRASNPEVVDLTGVNFDVVYRKHKIRGHGLSVQLKISSTAGEPFKIVGWSLWETANTHV